MKVCSCRVIRVIFDVVENQHDQKVRLGWMEMERYCWRWLGELELLGWDFDPSVYYRHAVAFRFHDHYHDHADWMVCFPW